MPERQAGSSVCRRAQEGISPKSRVTPMDDGAAPPKVDGEKKGRRASIKDIDNLDKQKSVLEIYAGGSGVAAAEKQRLKDEVNAKTKKLQRAWRTRAVVYRDFGPSLFCI